MLVVNSTLAEHAGLAVTARVTTLDGVEKASRRATVDVGPDAVTRALEVPEPDGLSPTYFLFLTLENAAGRVVSRNVYWLSTKAETLAWDKSQWYVTPVAQFADLTGLQRLPAAEVRASASFQSTGGEGHARVVLENPSKSLAFFLHASVRRGAAGEEVLPVLWEDNDLTLLPGERREIVAEYETKHLAGSRPAVRVEGWNVPATTASTP